jgi:outer membrane lipoprotein-sorting protein
MVAMEQTPTPDQTPTFAPPASPSRAATLRRLRWGVPVVAGAAVAAAAILPGVAAGSDHPSLPTRTATQLISSLLTAKPHALSGTIVETARLGLPELPSTRAGGSAELNLQNLVTGSHTARIWLDGPDRQRFALVGNLAESDVVHNGSQVWVYSSSANRATKLTVPAQAQGAAEKSLESKTILTPSQAAAQAIAAISPTTQVSVDATARVAGRAAYQIELSPRDTRSLITSVTITLDAQTWVPLRVQIYGHDRSTPAMETAFTDISYATPPASVFQFIPPTGAQIGQASPGDLLLGRVNPLGTPVATAAGGGPARTLVLPGATSAAGNAAAGHAGATHVIGSGWTAVLVTDGSALTGMDGGGPGSDLTALLLRSATAVPHGRLISTALLSFLLTDDGKLYIGAVSGAALEKVAATGNPL